MLPVDTRTKTPANMSATAPAQGLPPLPSLFAPHVLPAGADAMAEAARMAPVLGAGTLAWVDASDSAQAAVVLEPELPLAAARVALLAAATAAVDALVVLGPPEIPMTLRWPATVLVNGGTVGEALLATPPGTAETAVPDWMVAGIRLDMHGHAAEPGLFPDRTALAEEGFAEVPVPELVAAWARHLMAGLAEWQEEGFFRLSERVLERLEDAQGAALDPLDGSLLLPGGRRLSVMTDRKAGE